MNAKSGSVSKSLNSAFLNRAWNSSTGALALCDSSGTILRVNESFSEKFLRPGMDTCLGMDIDSLVTPAPWIAESDSIASIALSGTPLAINAVRENAEGKLVQVFLTVSSLSGKNSMKNIFFIIKPVPSESKKRSTDRMDNEAGRDTAFENSCEPSVITDSKGIVLKSNSAFTGELGWQLDELVNRDIREMLIPVAVQPEADYIAAMTGTGRTMKLTTSRLTSRGTELKVSLICKPLADGSVYRVYRTSDSRAMTESELFFRNRFRSCPNSERRTGMLFQCRTDRQRTMEFIVPETASFTGYSEEQLLSGETLYGSAILEIDRDMVMKTIQDSLISGKGYSITYRIRNCSGSILWVMEQGRAFKADRNSVDFCEGCIVDVTGIRDHSEQEDRARERIERLHTVAGELQRSRSAGEIYRICAEAGQSILDGACSCIFLQDGANMKIVASAGRGDFSCQGQCSLGMAEVALNTAGPCYFRSRDSSEGFCPAGSSGVCFKIGRKAVFQIMSRSSSMFGNMDTRILELLLGYTEQGLKRITLQHQLINQALHDPLTGIYNRNYFNRLIQLEEHRARRLDSAISFIMIDVDNFKQINDRYGHQVGDRVLQEVAKVLEGVLRKTDTVLRYGGDEFLIILTRMTKDYTHIVESRIASSLEKSNTPEELEGSRITVTMGHAFWTPDGEETIDEILKVADMIMLKNKKKKI